MERISGGLPLKPWMSRQPVGPPARKKGFRSNSLIALDLL